MMTTFRVKESSALLHDFSSYLGLRDKSPLQIGPFLSTLQAGNGSKLDPSVPDLSQRICQSSSPPIPACSKRRSSRT